MCPQQPPPPPQQQSPTLATLASKPSPQTIELTKEQFHDFRTRFVESPQGQLEFFHRTVFTAFDDDRNGVLDPAELDRFLETFYAAGSIFKGDARLPEKDVLRRLVNEKFDTNADGQLSFDEIHALISGKMDFSQ